MHDDQTVGQYADEQRSDDGAADTRMAMKNGSDRLCKLAMTMGLS